MRLRKKELTTENSKGIIQIEEKEQLVVKTAAHSSKIIEIGNKVFFIVYSIEVTCWVYKANFKTLLSTYFPTKF